MPMFLLEHMSNPRYLFCPNRAEKALGTPELGIGIRYAILSNELIIMRPSKKIKMSLPAFYCIVLPFPSPRTTCSTLLPPG